MDLASGKCRFETLLRKLDVKILPEELDCKSCHNACMCVDEHSRDVRKKVDKHSRDVCKRVDKHSRDVCKRDCLRGSFFFGGAFSISALSSVTEFIVMAVKPCKIGASAEIPFCSLHSEVTSDNMFAQTDC